MTNITFQINFEEDCHLIRNNFILFSRNLPLLLDNDYPNCNGFVLLDLNIHSACDFVTCLQGILKEVFNKVNLYSNEYYIIMRTAVERGRAYYDIDSEMGEWHELSQNNSTIRTNADFSLTININQTNEILKFITNLNKEDTKGNKEPNIREITLIRPTIMNGFFSIHDANYYRSSIKDTTDCKCVIQDGLHVLSFDLIKKDKGELIYPKLHDILLDNKTLESSFYGDFDDFDEIKDYCFSDIENFTANYKNSIVLDDIPHNDNSAIDPILKENDFTLMLFFHSLFPGVYEDSLKPQKFYDECYSSDATLTHDLININVPGHTCLGYSCIHDKVKNVLNNIIQYMIQNDRFVLKLELINETL